MPRLSDFRTKKDAIMLHMPNGYEKSLALSRLSVDMEREYGMQIRYDKAWQKQNPAAYDLYMEIRESRYKEEGVVSSGTGH